jgi:hypothetical protein
VRRGCDGEGVAGVGGEELGCRRGELDVVAGVTDFDASSATCGEEAGGFRGVPVEHVADGGEVGAGERGELPGAESVEPLSDGVGWYLAVDAGCGDEELTGESGAHAGGKGELVSQAATQSWV